MRVFWWLHNDDQYDEEEPEFKFGFQPPAPVKSEEE